MLKIIAASGVVLVSSFLFFFSPYNSSGSEQESESSKDEENAKQQITTDTDSLITIVAVGDIMMGSNYPTDAGLPPAGVLLLDPMHAFLQAADVTFGNLEGTVLNSGGNPKKCGDPSKCYAFRQPEYFVDQLKKAGFDFLSVANNHMGDFGDPGRLNTQKVLKAAGIRYAGLTSCPWDTLTVKGVKIGMTAFAPNTGCLKIKDYATLKSTVAMLNKTCDIVIVSFHGGAEGSSRTHVPKATEIFYGEDRGNVYEFAHTAIDAGADVVLGHGPHVTRAIDCYKGRFITYSMGNFCTYDQFNLKGVSGMAPLFKLTLRKDGTLVSGEVISTKQIGRGGPLLDTSFGAFNQIMSLTKADFPDLKVNFGEKGSFTFPK